MHRRMREKAKKTRNAKRVTAWILVIAIVLSGINMPGTANVRAEEIQAAEKESEALYELYAAKILGILPKDEMLSAESAGKLLEGNDLAVYEALKPELEKVADGERDNASISIQINSLLSKQQFTVEELGLEAGTEMVVDNAISEEVINALLQKIAFRFDTVLNSLLQDCYYEMYWYEKTIGCGCSQSLGPRVSGDSIGFTDESVYIFDFTVDPAYRSEADDKTSVDTEKTGVAKSAMANALDIVSAAQGKSDYEKLTYYREQICALVSYDDSAATSGSQEFGTIAPWQIINVFDENPDTNVVCEGYAKAFAYLCEKTTFSSSKIQVYTVSGTMDGATGSGGHMWNIVHMEDGNNYLVDVTNCDEGTIGVPDYLFLQGYDGEIKSEEAVIGYTITIPQRPIDESSFYPETEIEYCYDSKATDFYAWSELVLSSADYNPASVEPSPETTPVALEACAGAAVSADMLKEYRGWTWKEGETDKVVPNVAGNIITATAVYDNTLEKDVTITAKGHVLSSHIDAVEATCVAKGNKEYWQCSACEKYFLTENATEAVTREETVTALNEDNHIGETEVRDAVEATCQAGGYTGDTYCKACGKMTQAGTETAKDPNHHVGDTEVVGEKEPTCTDTGFTGDVKCKDCHVTLTAGDEIPATGHMNREIRNASTATYESEGYTGDEYCLDCGAKLATGEVIPKEILPVGEVVKDDASKGNYEITASDEKKHEVSYDKPSGTKTATVTVPQTIKIGDTTYKVTKINDKAFKANKSVRKITLGSNITAIGREAFSGCKNLKTITIKSAKLTAKTVTKNAFKGITSKTCIKVPKKKLKAYKKLFRSKGLSSKVTVKGF